MSAYREGVKPDVPVEPLTRDEYDALCKLLFRAGMTTAKSDRLVPGIYQLAYTAAQEQWLYLA